MITNQLITSTPRDKADAVVPMIIFLGIAYDSTVIKPWLISSLIIFIVFFCIHFILQYFLKIFS